MINILPLNKEETPEMKKTFFYTGLIAIPTMAKLIITPIFIVTGNDIWLLPIVLFFASIPITFVWVINRYLQKRMTQQVSYLLLSFGSVLGFTILLRMSVLPLFKSLEGTMIRNIPHFFVAAMVGMVVNIMVIILMTLIRLRFEHLEVVKENESLKFQSMNARFQNLKNQLQPHFIFNALNTLKVLIRRNPQEAETYVLQLSDFLRSSIESNKKASNSLEEELQIAKNYLDLQKMRFGASLEWQVQVEANFAKSHFLPILCLQTLVENALKHNIFTKENPLKIRIEQKTDGKILVKNNLNKKEVAAEESSGIGLANLSERFVLLGGEVLRIQEEDGDFCVLLKPFDNEHRNY